MRYDSLTDFLNTGSAALAKGPVALIMVEDLVEVDSTIRHHQNAGFAAVVVFAPPELVLPEALEARIHRVTHDVTPAGAVEATVNAINNAAPGLWLYYCYNAEYLFHPFCEHRSIGELLAFHTEERRDAVLTYVIDLYARRSGRVSRARCRWRMPVSTSPATMRWRATMPTSIPRNGS